MTAKFELQISNQHWLGDSQEQQTHDGCSHGGIHAVIGGIVVTSDDAEYGVSQSALALLRTLAQDHSRAERVTDYYLLCHGCGYPINFGCSNFGTDWVVRHQGDEVFLSQPIHVDVSGDAEFDVRVRVRIEDYRHQVVSFAQTAHDFYFAAGPRSVEEWEQDFHDRFWEEFDERLERAKAATTDEVA